MSNPIQQHYLPKVAYLSFFENSQRPGFIYLYQRSTEPVLTNIKNVAQERYLYSFVDENGQYNFEIEKALETLEARTRPILQKLNQGPKSLPISAVEKGTLSEFIAYQAVRIPAFRRKVLQEINSKFLEVTALAMAQRKEVLAAHMEKARQRNPSNSHEDTVSAEELQRLILEGDFTCSVSGDDYFLGQALQVGNHLFPAILMKKIFLLYVTGTSFITSDYPVFLLSDPNLGLYGSGFLMARILLPIGSHAILYLENENNPTLLTEDQIVDVRYQKISPSKARWINKCTIAHAENYLFASEANEGIKKLFDRTKPPERFQVSHLFQKTRGRYSRHCHSQWVV